MSSKAAALGRPRRRPRVTVRVVVVAVVLLIGALAAGLLLEQRRVTPGPLETMGIDGTGFGMEVGRTGSWGATVIYNTGDTEAVLERIRPIDVPAGLEIPEILIAGPKRRVLYVGSTRVWPTDRLTDLQPVDGSVVPPVAKKEGNRGVEIVVVVRGRKPGRYVISRLEVTYRVGGRQHRRVVRGVLALCASERLKDGIGSCSLPKDLPK